MSPQEPVPVAEAPPAAPPILVPASEPLPTAPNDTWPEAPELSEPTTILPQMGMLAPVTAPIAEHRAEAVTSEEPDLVVTETMADVFLRQGHKELALAVYTQLLQREAESPRIRDAVERLQMELAPPPAPSPAPPSRVEPLYAAAESGGQAVGDFFRAILRVPPPGTAAGTELPASSVTELAGEPTRPSQDTLSLSAVFGEEMVPAEPAQPGVAPASAPAGEGRGEGAGAPSFDEFFGSSPADSSEPSPSPAPSGPGSAPGVEDLEQFNAWLRGLKR